MNSDVFKNRLREAIGEKSINSFAKKSGVREGNLRKYLSSETLPGTENLIAIADTANVNIEWLATGRGPKDKGRDIEGEGVLSKDFSPGRGITNIDPDEFTYLPLYNIKASAGGGYIVETEEIISTLAFRRSWIHMVLKASPADLYLIHVEGESMEPTLRPGDITLIDRRDATFTKEGIYVIRMDGTLLVKRLQRLPGGVIKVTSDNPQYEPFVLDGTGKTNGFEIIGRVVWMGRRI